MPRLTARRLHALALLALLAALVGCGHARPESNLPPTTLLGRPLAGDESVLFLRVQLADTTGVFNGFVRVVLEGPIEGSPERFELVAGRSDPASVAAAIASPPAKLSEVVTARAQPGTYRLSQVAVGAGASNSGGRLAVRVLTVSLPRELVVPPARIVYLGVLDVTTARVGTQIRTQVRHHSSAATLLPDLKQVQRAHRSYLGGFLARSPDVFAPRLKPLARAVPPSKQPVCSARNVGECARACDQGDGRCCSDLGYLYERGEGVPKDLARMISLYARGCELGNSLSCKNLGVMYLNGTGVDPNPARAVIYFRQSCEMGDPRGCFSLGQSYASGKGVGVDLARAMALLTQACTAGVAAACNDAGWILHAGKGEVRDPARMTGLFQRACSLGSVNGCSSYGWSLAIGDGVEKDPAQALVYLQRGCRGGNAWGCEKQKLLCEQGHAPACAAGSVGSPSPPPATPAPAPLAPAPAPAAAGTWGDVCAAHSAYSNLRWTISLSQKVAGGKSSSSKHTLAIERDVLLALVQRVRPEKEPALAALQRQLVAAIQAAPAYRNPVPRHLGGGADMVVSDALKARLARYWIEVLKRAARHGTACASVSTGCPPGSPIIDGKCAVK